MNTITEACDKLREYLSNWYTANKGKGSNKGAFCSLDLRNAKNQFVKLNPEYEKFDRDIHFGFETLPESYVERRFCSNGCCDIMDCMARIKCRGVYVIPVDWDRIRKLAS